MKRSLSLTAALVAMAFASLPAAATASTQIGQTFVPFGALSGTLVLQSATVAPTPSYAVPAGGGVITSMSMIASSAPAGSVKFIVLRPNGTDYQAIAVSDPKTLDLSFMNTVQMRVPVKAGDLIAMKTSTSVPVAKAGPSGDNMIVSAVDPTTNQFVPGASFSPFTSTVLDESATLEPDADADGFGDETQDQCSTDASTQGPCPAPPDKTAPTASLSSAATQDALKQGAINVVVSSNEAGSASATGTLAVPGASKTFKLNPASASLTAGAKATLKLTLTKKTKTAVKKALNKRKKLKANIALVVRDAAGNATTSKQTIKLKGKKKKK